MDTSLTLKTMLTTIFQLAIITLPAVAQPGQLPNLLINPNGELVITPSKTSSKNDFDFFMGKWKLSNRMLKTRLNGSTKWVTFDARQQVRPILRGIGNIDSYSAVRNNAPFEGMTLRLFDPKTRLWSIYWADSNSGKLDPPVVGSFENNVGTFYTNDVFKGKNIIMQFKWDKTDPDKPKWSQAFSADNGKTWEWNWYMDFERENIAPVDAELGENQTIKVLELRNYIMKPGKREDFIAYFEQHFITPQNILGGYVLGQFRVKDHDDRFMWFRGFEDMAARSIYLPEFYRKSLVWKKYKAGANALIDDNDDVHLLKPLDSAGINTNDFAKHKGIVVVDYYTANDGSLDKLTRLMRAGYVPQMQAIGINNTSLWVSELTPNDYPSLPVIQDKNLLAAITFYADEADYQSKMELLKKGNAKLQGEINRLLAKRETLIVYPTEQSFGSAE